MRRLNAFDTACVTVIVLSALGFGLAKAQHTGVNQVIQGVHKVNIDIFFIGVKTLDPEIFKVGEKSAITIRNRPVEPPMTISKVDRYQHKASFLSSDGKSAVAFADPAVPIAYDFTVTVQDDAEETEDGYVVRGNKIKIGNQVELEGKRYREQGVVVNITPADAAK